MDLFIGNHVVSPTEGVTKESPVLQERKDTSFVTKESPVLQEMKVKYQRVFTLQYSRRGRLIIKKFSVLQEKKNTMFSPRSNLCDYKPSLNVCLFI